MRSTTVMLALILATPLAAQPAPSLETRIAAAMVKLDINSTVLAEDIRVQGLPAFRGEQFELALTRPKFDKTLRNWTVEVRCLPRSACIPFLVTISGDRELSLFRSEQSRYLVHAGERRFLTFATGEMRIKREVVCLQSGRPGDIIRVRFAGNSTVTYGRVSDAGSITAQGLR